MVPPWGLETALDPHTFLQVVGVALLPFATPGCDADGFANFAMKCTAHSVHTNQNCYRGSVMLTP